MREILTSKQNKWIKQLRQLRLHKGPWQAYSIVEGERLCYETIRAEQVNPQLEIIAAFAAESFAQNIRTQTVTDISGTSASCAAESADAWTEVPLYETTDNSNRQDVEILRKLQKLARKDSLFVLSDELFSYVGQTKNPQGILLVIAPPEYGGLPDLRQYLLDIYGLTVPETLQSTQYSAAPKAPKEPKDTCARESLNKSNEQNGIEQAQRLSTFKSASIIVLENIQDPGNLGTILRTAYAFNYDAAIITGMVINPFSEKVLRSSMGASFYLPTYVVSDTREVLAFCQENDLDVLAMLLDGTKLDQYIRRDRISLWIGNEGNGLSEAVARAASTKLTIPMPGGAESLNAAVAAGIALYALQL